MKGDGESWDWGLDALTQPLGSEKFLAEVWPKTMFIGNGPVERHKPILDLPELASVEALLGAASDPIRVWPPPNERDGHAQLARPVDALRMYHDGWTIYLNHSETVVPALLPFVRRIERELGLHYGDVATEVFASKASAGARPHCDFDFGFNIQLRGKKTWCLAPNTSFANPHKSVIASDPFDPEVAAYAKGPLPREMPTEGAREAIAEPGTVIFLPRGYWHTTVAHEPSLALTFACKGATWSQLVARELEVHLRALEEWRELPERWVGSSGVTRVDKEKRLAALLRELPRLTSELDAKALVAKWTTPRTRLYAVHEETTLLEDAEGSILCIGRDKRMMRLPSELSAVVKAIVSSRSPFSVEDAASIAARSIDAVHGIVESLVHEGALRVLT